MNKKETTIPQQHENPNGLHGRYFVQKIVPNDPSWEKGWSRDRYVTKDVDPGSEYFIMRLDNGGSDPEHIKACLIGVNAYADAIEHHLPQLAKDLRERYPVSPALGGRSIQSEGPSASECGGDRPEGQRPDNQLLPQETTTQNMKTAESILQEEYLKSTEYLASIRTPSIPNVYKEGVLNAMRLYAKQLIEADRKDAAEKTADWFYDQGIYGYGGGVKSCILNRPLPPMQ